MKDITVNQEVGMKRRLLAVAISIVAGSTTVMAQDFQQYISGKGAVVRLENKLTGTGIYRNKESLINSLDHKKSDTVGGLRVAYGLAFPMGDNRLRTEIEYGFNGKAKLDGNMNYFISNDTAAYPPANIGYKSEIKSQFVMANLYYDFNTGSDWTPYVGAGLGYARVKADNSVNYAGQAMSLSKSSNNFAWNLTAGLSYQVTDDLVIDASYRYIDYGKVDTSGRFDLGQKYHHDVNTRSKVRSNELNIGVRYTFPKSY